MKFRQGKLTVYFSIGLEASSFSGPIGRRSSNLFVFVYKGFVYYIYKRDYVIVTWFGQIFDIAM
jgi:hypothetical protein